MRKFIDQVMFRLEQGWGLIDALSLTNWLRGVQTGKQRERDRIISIIEKLAYKDEDGHEMIGEFKSDLIALIKGEQK